ncbi:pyridoxal 5'-phosphate synthase glutaminase subunit PdxT, partial [Lacticaseibacillus rhamnosus]
MPRRSAAGVRPLDPDALHGSRLVQQVINKVMLDGKKGGTPIEMVFIRAPKISRVGAKVEVLATEGADPVAVRQGKVMAATFHPELSDDRR